MASTKTTHADALATKARELADSLANTVTTIQSGGRFEIDVARVEDRILAALRNIRAEALREAAAVVDQCNREGPYNAIGAAPRIRALLDWPVTVEADP